MFYVQQPFGVERSSPKAAHAGGSRRAQGAELWVDGDMPKKRENRIWWEYEWERQYHGKYEWKIFKYSHISHFMDLWYFPLFSIIILGVYPIFYGKSNEKMGIDVDQKWSPTRCLLWTVSTLNLAISSKTMCVSSYEAPILDGDIMLYPYITK